MIYFSALKIHTSRQTRDLLERLGGFIVEERGQVEMKVNLEKTISVSKYNNIQY